jgi:hypothetical protein
MNAVIDLYLLKKRVLTYFNVSSLSEIITKEAVMFALLAIQTISIQIRKSD